VLQAPLEFARLETQGIQDIETATVSCEKTAILN
jgi:hypothetical protein